MNHAEQILDQMVEAAVQLFWRHPGTAKTGIPYRHCTICKSEWPAAAQPVHKEIHSPQGNIICPIQQAEAYLDHLSPVNAPTPRNL